jgi:hypothetical protein
MSPNQRKPSLGSHQPQAGRHRHGRALWCNFKLGPGRGAGTSLLRAPLTLRAGRWQWVAGFKFYGEQSKALAGVANMIADAQTAKWQASLRYGRDRDPGRRTSNGRGW